MSNSPARCPRVVRVGRVEEQGQVVGGAVRRLAANSQWHLIGYTIILSLCGGNLFPTQCPPSTINRICDLRPFYML